MAHEGGEQIKGSAGPAGWNQITVSKCQELLLVAAASGELTGFI